MIHTAEPLQISGTNQRVAARAYIVHSTARGRDACMLIEGVLISALPPALGTILGHVLGRGGVGAALPRRSLRVRVRCHLRVVGALALVRGAVAHLVRVRVGLGLGLGYTGIGYAAR